jgi:alpha-tubulin suppressor-like RCC1 family protein
VNRWSCKQYEKGFLFSLHLWYIYLACSECYHNALSSPPEIVSLAAGNDHVLALTIDGSVFSWGSWGERILASLPEDGKEKSCMQTTKICTKRLKFSEMFGFPAFLQEHTIRWCLQKMGSYIFPGDCILGREGSGLQISEIACGGSHVLFLLENNELFTYGETTTPGD